MPGEPVVFVVDDSLEQAEEIAEYLGRAGFWAHVYVDASDAIREVGALQPALILLDVNMPDCDGVRAAKYLNNLAGRIPLILMSGDPLHLQEAEAADIGVLAVLPKPLNLREIANFVQRALAFEVV
jgi:CheY-like chemotaxis protein